MRHLIGLTRQCVPTGIVESKVLSARSRVIIYFYFTSQMVVSRTGGQFPRWYSDFLLFINICTKGISDLLVLWTNYGDIGPTIWRPLNQGEPNYMHGPLLMRVCPDLRPSSFDWNVPSISPLFG
jgi:hypothetical protein